MGKAGDSSVCSEFRWGEFQTDVVFTNEVLVCTQIRTFNVNAFLIGSKFLKIASSWLSYLQCCFHVSPMSPVWAEIRLQLLFRIVCFYVSMYIFTTLSYCMFICKYVYLYGRRWRIMKQFVVETMDCLNDAFLSPFYL